MVLLAVADYLGWVHPHTDDWGVDTLCGTVCGAVFFIDMVGDGCLRALCVACSTSSGSNSFMIHSSDPDMFDKLESWMNSFNNNDIRVV